MDLIEDIGPILGIVAFLGFAILALLIVLQAREVRRLREWAGRAPERALEADDAAQAAAEASGEADPKPGRIAATRDRIAAFTTPKWNTLDRRSPIDPALLLGALVVALVAAAVVTSGFGLVGSGDEPAPDEPGTEATEGPLEVAVLNATQQEGVSDPVPGIADFVMSEVVEPGGYEMGEKADAPEGMDDSVVMFVPGADDEAEELAADAEDLLGQTEIQPMSRSVREQVERAPLAILVGFRDGTIIDEAGAP